MQPNGHHLKCSRSKLITSLSVNVIYTFLRGFAAEDVEVCGTRLNFYKWSEQKLIKSVDLGVDGTTPLEIRFLHNPNEPQGYVGCALFANLFYFCKKDDSDDFEVKKVVDIPAKKVEGWMLPELNGLMGDIILSLDDKFLYFNNWLHGDVRQYDITDRANPKMVGQVFLGGVSVSDSGIEVTEDLELEVIVKNNFFLWKI